MGAAPGFLCVSDSPGSWLDGDETAIQKFLEPPDLAVVSITRSASLMTEATA